MCVQGVDYAILSQSPPLLASFKRAVSTGVAAEVGVSKEAVSLILSAGSVQVEATIKAVDAVHATDLTSKLSISRTLASTVCAMVSKVDGITAATTGSIS